MRREEHPEPSIRVVLAEAEPGAGFLRFVLEGERFDIVAQAANDEELAVVLESAPPSVLVVDAGISALAADEAKRRRACAAIVAVWPPGVAAVVAEERVDPDRVVEELGDAVRRAVHHPGAAEARTDAPHAERSSPGGRRADMVSGSDVPGHVAPRAGPSTHAGRRARRRTLRAALVTMVVYAAAVSAIAAAVVGGDLDVARDRDDGRSVAEAPLPAPDAPAGAIVDPPDGDPPRVSERDDAGALGPERDRTPAGGTRNPAERGAPGERGRGEAPRGSGTRDEADDHPGKGHRGHAPPGKGHGRDDAPGKGNANGRDGGGEGEGPGGGNANGRSDAPGRGGSGRGGGGGAAPGSASPGSRAADPGGKPVDPPRGPTNGDSGGGGGRPAERAPGLGARSER